MNRRKFLARSAAAAGATLLAKARGRPIAPDTRWIELALEGGAGSARSTPAKINTADLSPTVSSYKALAAHGASEGIFVIIENHGGVGSEHPEELVELFKAVGKNCGALPDFGNFPRSEEHTSELQSQSNLVCRLLLEKKKNIRPTLAYEAHRPKR